MSSDVRWNACKHSSIQLEVSGVQSFNDAWGQLIDVEAYTSQLIDLEDYTSQLLDSEAYTSQWFDLDVYTSHLLNLDAPPPILSP